MVTRFTASTVGWYGNSVCGVIDYQTGSRRSHYRFSTFTSPHGAVFHSRRNGYLAIPNRYPKQWSGVIFGSCVLDIGCVCYGSHTGPAISETACRMMSFDLAMLFAVGLTVAVYWLSLVLYRISGANAFLHPIITSTLILMVGLLSVDYAIVDFQRLLMPIDWLLGPATVALAIPLYRQVQVVKQYGWRILLPIIAGGIIAPLLAWLSVIALDAPLDLQLTLMAKSITTPLAIDVTSVIGGIPPLVAVIVIITGIIGAIASPLIFSALRISNPIAQGIALGTVAHAMGTAKAIQVGEVPAALATLSLCVNGVFTALCLPLVFAVF